MKNKFLHKNIIVTGGSSGIGLALTKQFIDLGANVWIIGRDKKKLEKVKSEINSNSINIIAADVSQLEDLQNVYQNFLKDNVHIDFLINSAGVTHPGEFDELDCDIFHWMMDINYFGTVYSIKTFLPLMCSGSTIVNISSMAAILGIYGYTAYSASKYAVRGFSDSLRSEMKIKGINVSIVFPPDTKTPQLEYESQFKPKITKELSSNGGVMSAEKVAQSIINGINRKHYMIIPGFESNVIYNLSNIFGKMTFPIMDLMVSSAIKKINHQSIQTD